MCVSSFMPKKRPEQALVCAGEGNCKRALLSIYVVRDVRSASQEKVKAQVEMLHCAAKAWLVSGTRFPMVIAESALRSRTGATRQTLRRRR